VTCGETGSFSIFCSAATLYRRPSNLGQQHRRCALYRYRLKAFSSFASTACLSQHSANGDVHQRPSLASACGSACKTYSGRHAALVSARNKFSPGPFFGRHSLACRRVPAASRRAIRRPPSILLGGAGATRLRNSLRGRGICCSRAPLSSVKGNFGLTWNFGLAVNYWLREEGTFKHPGRSRGCAAQAKSIGCGGLGRWLTYHAGDMA